MKSTTKRLLSAAICAVQAASMLSLGITASAADKPLPSTDTIAAGSVHSLVIKSDKTLWAAGSNSYGQLGTSLGTTSSSGVKVMDKVVAVEANDNTSFAIDENGTLYGWGDNAKGQINPGTKDSRIETPAEIMKNVKLVSVGDTHTVAVTEDGTAYGWGSNSSGELGFDENHSKNKPVKLMSNIADAAAGNGFTVLVTNMGDVYVSGDNTHGQLGSAYTENFHNFGRIDVSNITDVEAGDNHVLLLRKDGKVLAAGLNDRGQVGASSRDEVATFTDVDIYGVTDIYAGASSSGAVTSAGKVYTWGANNNGQLQNKDNNDVFSPEAAVKSNVVSIAFGDNHSVLLKDDGSVNTVGNGISGELFNEISSVVDKPAKIMSNVIAYSAGQDHAAAVDTDGNLYTWGNNDRGQLGTGDYISKSVADKTRVLTDVKNVWCGNKCTFAQTNDDKMYVFGDNGGYLLGMETDEQHVLRPTRNNDLCGYSNVDIQFGNGFVIALMDESVFGWGTNSGGRLQDCPSSVKYPVSLSDDLGKIQKVAVGNSFVIALEVNGAIYGWGGNGSHQLTSSIDNMVTEVPTEIVITDPKTETQISFDDISAAKTHVMAVDNQNNVWVWGTNSSNQLGGSSTRIKVPEKLVEDAYAVIADENVCAIIDPERNLLVCGSNINGALGTGSTANLKKYKEIAQNVIHVSLGLNFGGYIRDDATLFCWGDNTFGQVGNGANGMSTTPKTVIKNGLCKGLTVADSITLSKTQLTIKPKSSAKLTVSTSPKSVDYKGVMWVSSNEKVATVSADGTVKAVANGNAVITAIAAGGAKAECKVTVAVPVSSFSVTPKSSKTIKTGGSFTFKTKVYPSNATDKTLLFESSDPKVARVSSKGKVTGVSAGVAEITVTAKSNPEKSRVVTVYVQPKKAKLTSRKATADGVVLEWKSVKNVDGYTIYRSTSKNGKATAVASVEDGLAYIDASAKAGKTYYYFVKTYIEVDGKKIYSNASAKYKVKAK